MKIKSVIFLPIAATTMLIFPLLSQAASPNSCVKNEKGFLNISGEYICTVYCPAGGQGKSAYVTQDGNVLKFINEAGEMASGTISGYKAKAVEWNTTLTVANNCQELLSSNTTVWLRK